MKIDVHMHLTPPDLIKNCHKYYDKEPYFKLLSESPQNKFADGEDLIGILDETGFDKGVAFGFSFKDLGLCRYVNDYTMEVAKKYPDRVIGFMSISPLADGAVEEIRRCYEGGLRGIGELFLDGQGVDPFDEESLKPFMRACEEYDLPIMIHANEPVGHYYTGKVDVTPKEVASIASMFPANKLILAHFGGGLPFYELMKEMKKTLSNVYYDTGAGIYLYTSNIFKVLKEIGCLDRVLFGSDYPLLSPARFEKYFCESGLCEEDLEKVMGENCKKLLKL